MSKFNADELDPPQWLDKEFFGRVMKEVEKNEAVKILDMEIKPASLKGDHYASIIFRASVKYTTFVNNDKKTIEKSLIIKTMPSNDGTKANLLNNSNIFETEIQMYTKIVPKFEEILRMSGDNTVFGPKMLYSSLKPHEVIIFEDLCLQNFEVLRDRKLNADEVEKVLQRLAKWHAVSYKLAADGDRSITELNNGFFNLSNFVESNLISGGIRLFTELIEEMEEFQKYLPKVKILQSNMIERCKAMTNSFRNDVHGPIYVLNHGDFHVKNMMFKYDDEGKINDFRFFDFQCSFYGPSMYDIVYSSYLLMSEELRKSGRDEMIRLYFQHFIEMLKQIHYDGPLPALNDFKSDQKRFSVFEMFLITTFLPMIIAGETEKAKTDDIELDEVFDSQDFCRPFFKRKEYIDYLRENLPKLFEAGYLD